MNDSKERLPIKVLMLFTILNRGGAETMVMNYYRAIDRSKVQFDFVVHREEEGDYEEEIRSLGGKIYRMMPLRPHTFGKYERQISVFFDEHPEYQIIHGQCSESGYFFYKEAARRGIPVIIAHAHSSHVDIDMKWIVRTWLKHKMRPYLTHYFACGKEAAEWLFGKQLAKKSIILKNAIDTQRFYFNEETRKKKRMELGIASNTLAVCHVGSFVKVKNHLFIIDIMKKMLDITPNSQLFLTGDGEEKLSIEHLVKSKGMDDHVTFLGRRSDVPQLLQAFDIMVFPSHFEGLPVTLIEAQCAGLPCVISNNIPKEVILTDLVEQISLDETATTWAEKLIATVSRPFDRATHAEKVASAGFDIKENSKWLEKFYLNALSKRQ